MHIDRQPSIVPAACRCVGILLFVLAASGTAHADSVRFGLRVIIDGDSSAKLLDVAGHPDSTKRVKASKKHADGGERWIYQREGKTIEFTLHEGVVTAITTHRAK
jgi:P pilus assembly chaperone PapD